MRCNDCPYYYLSIEDGDDFECCHFKPMAPGELPPCEYDDDNWDEYD